MIRVLVVDDHEVVRWGIEQVLDPEPEMEVVAAAADGSTALDLVARLPVDVVLMDLSMRRVGGVEATWRLREIAPGCGWWCSPRTATARTARRPPTRARPATCSRAPRPRT